MKVNTFFLHVKSEYLFMSQNFILIYTYTYILFEWNNHWSCPVQKSQVGILGGLTSWLQSGARTVITRTPRTGEQHQQDRSMFPIYGYGLQQETCIPHICTSLFCRYLTGHRRMNVQSKKYTTSCPTQPFQVCFKNSVYLDILHFNIGHSFFWKLLLTGTLM